MTKKIFPLIMVLALGWGSTILAEEIEENLPVPVSSDTSIQGELAPSGAKDIMISVDPEEISVGPEESAIIAEVIQEIEEEQTVLPEDLEVKEPKLLPSSPWYFAKDWWRDTKLFFTFNPIKKAELRQKIADEKLLELKKMAEAGVEAGILERAKNRYEVQQQKLQTAIEKLKEREIKKPGQLEAFQEKFTRHQILHNKILEKLVEQVPEQAFEKMQEMREKHLEMFGETMFKLEDKDKIPERLENALQNIKGSELKEFRQLEFLRKVENKMEDEDEKEKLQEAEELIIEQLKIKVEALPAIRQQRIKTYVEHLPGDKEYQLEVIEKLKEQVEDKGEIKQGLEEASIRLRTRIRELKQIAPSIKAMPTQEINE